MPVPDDVWYTSHLFVAHVYREKAEQLFAAVWAYGTGYFMVAAEKMLAGILCLVKIESVAEAIHETGHALPSLRRAPCAPSRR